MKKLIALIAAITILLSALPAEEIKADINASQAMTKAAGKAAIETGARFGIEELVKTLMGRVAAQETISAPSMISSVPVYDMANNTGNINNTLNDITKELQHAKERWQDKLWRIFKDEIKRQIIDSMVDQIINWIQGNGKPKFITDWKGFLSDAANAGVGDVLQELNLGFLCEPFSAQLRLYLTPPPKFSQEVSCTLDDVISNIKDFANDFRNGSWIAYEYAWRPENNFYGAYLITTDEMIARAKENKEAAKAEGIANKGFLSTKKCIVETSLPNGKTKCLKWETTTPGSLIASAAQDSLNLQIKGLLSADEVEGYIAAIADAAINRLIREGVNGLSGVFTKSSSSHQSEIYNSERRYHSQQSGILGEGKGTIITQIDTELSYRKEGVKYILNSEEKVQEAISNQKALLNCLQGLKTEETNQEIADKIKKTNQEISDLENKLKHLKEEQGSQEKRIKELNDYEDEVNQMTDYEQISKELKNVWQKVDYSQAYSDKENYKKENQDIKKDMDKLNKQAQQDLTSCQNYNLPANQ